MDKQELLRKVERFIEQAEREELWGSLEIDFRQGKVTLLRKHKTVLLENATTGEHRGKELSKKT